MTTTAATPQQEQRGAGSGASATRSRNLVDWPPEPKPHGEHVDELEAERDAQAEFNDELNELQTKQAEDLSKKIRELAAADPESADEVREEAKKAFETANDPKKKEAALKGEMEARAKRDKAAAAAQQGQK